MSAPAEFNEPHRDTKAIGAPCDWCGFDPTSVQLLSHQKEPCLHKSGIGFTCTRPKPHGGFHVACCKGLHDVARWQVAKQVWRGGAVLTIKHLESFFGPVQSGWPEPFNKASP